MFKASRRRTLRILVAFELATFPSLTLSSLSAPFPALFFNICFRFLSLHIVSLDHIFLSLLDGKRAGFFLFPPREILIK